MAPNTLSFRSGYPAERRFMSSFISSRLLSLSSGQVVGTSGRPSSRTKEAMVPSPR